MNETQQPKWWAHLQTKMVTVRMTEALFEKLHRIAEQRRTSLNRLCLEALENIEEQDDLR